MDRRKQLNQMYQEIPIIAGIYQVKNLKNQKMFIRSTRNLKTINGVKFTLESGTHINKELQKDWQQYGADAFSIEVLEELKKSEEPYFNEKEALKELETKWLEQLQPYGEQGYNRKK